MQVALMLLGLVSTQAQLISRSTHSAKLPFYLLFFFQKAAAVVVIVKFACMTMRNGGRGRMHKTN